MAILHCPGDFAYIMLSFKPTSTLQVSTTTTPILHIGKLRHREVEQLENANLGSEPKLLTTKPPLSFALLATGGGLIDQWGGGHFGGKVLSYNTMEM